MGTEQSLWQMEHIEPGHIKKLVQETGLPEFICTLLYRRGLQDEKDFRHFLHPRLNALPLPYTLMGVEQAAGLIWEAKNTNQQIIIYGDYDVDGVTSTALLVIFLRKIEVSVFYYHPNRLDHGYGLSIEVIDQIAAQHPGGLLITVDCGISDLDAVAYAKEKGLKVIVTDHHIPPSTLPEADVIINPHQKGCSFPYKYLAGVGLAFYLIIGLRQKLREEGYWTTATQPNLKELLDIVAIGTVADMVPLLDINRVLVRAGMDYINGGKLQNVGLCSLLKVCNIKGSEVNSEDIGFQIGPRINAVGRLGSAQLATDLLVCDDPHQAQILAVNINEVNEQRKKLAAVQTEAALEQAKKQVNEGRGVIVLHDNDWHIGLIGIIAARVCDFSKKPTIVLTGFPLAKGSARTVPSCNIYSLLNHCSATLEQFGGHKMAAGLTINTLKIQGFIDAAEGYVLENKASDDSLQLSVDAILPVLGSRVGFYENYKLIEPFGQDNPRPKFVLDAPSYLRNVQVVGKNKEHLRFSVQIFGEYLNGIGFGFGHLCEQLGSRKTNILFSLSENWFRRNMSWQVVLHDVEILAG